MMSTEQEQQITDYLIFHRLPLDILLEVKDHMISQVLDIQSDENLNFDEAFLKTKKLWESEFKSTGYSAFYHEQIPVIVKRIVKIKYNAIFKKSLLLGLVSFAVNLLLIYLSADQEMYNDLFRLYNCLFFLVPFLIWIFNPSMRKYVKRDFKFQGKLNYTMYQQNLGMYVICANVMFQLILREDKHAYRFFRTESPVEIFPLLITLIMPYILQVFIIFLLINFFEHKKTLVKIKDFIKVSEA
ncbi:hypothetical protein [Chryseobacterium daeguense]|uniref:hypothetical protein n=1 Tax=Chryseobacterium daeguense TaxID=412438 RepID=UPI0012DEC9A1|nr:hypothetical protein [Chryseobacterium daeguense]